MIKSLAAAAVIGVAFASTAVAATVAGGNGSFASNGGFVGSFTTLGTGNGTLSGWSVDSGSIDLINTYWQSSDGDGYSIDMSGNGPSSISTTVSGLNTGSRYVLSFDAAANPDGDPLEKTLRALIANATLSITELQNGGTRAAMNWFTYTLEFTAGAGTEVLSFFNNDTRTNNTPFGVALDNVRVAAVPLPAGGLLLLGALGGIAALRRRRKAA